MSLIKCDKCGELFSDSYRRCPFCAEDEEYYRGNAKKGNRRGAAGEKKRGVLVPVLVLAVVLLAAGSGWYFFGDQIKSNVIRDPVKSAAEDVDKEKDPGQEVAPPVVLTMDSTLRIEPEQSETIQISGGTSYEWISSDPTVATVSKDGTVTAIGEGTAVITATDTSGQSAVCSVTVAEMTDEPENGNANEGDTGSTTTKPTKPTGGNTTKVDLSAISIKVPLYGTELPKIEDGVFGTEIGIKEGSYQMQVAGSSAKVIWSSANPNIASIDSDGNLKWVSPGFTKITGKIGDATITIEVRAK